MKVDPNSGFFPDAKRLEMLRSTLTTEAQKETIFIESRGIPVRLAIAAQIMAAQCANGFVPFSRDNQSSHDPQFRAERALEWADALIAAHNESQK